MHIDTHTHESRDTDVAAQHFDNNLTNVLDWSKKFDISINPNKCQAIIVYSLRRIALLNCARNFEQYFYSLLDHTTAHPLLLRSAIKPIWHCVHSPVIKKNT